MVVDDADDFGFIDAIDDLFSFVVVDEDDRLFFDSSDAIGTDHANISAFFDDDKAAFSRDVMAVVFGLEELFRIMGESLDRREFFTGDGLDEFVGELVLFDDADELAVVNNRSDIAVVGCEPVSNVLQAARNLDGSDFGMDGFADLDIEIFDERLCINLEVAESISRFLIDFTSADSDCVDALELF